jgi:peptide deformylase
MAIRKITQIGHPSIKAKNKRIINLKSTKLKKLIKDLKDTMRKAELVGMSAPQIDENYCVFVTEPRKTKTRTIDLSDEFKVYINPKIIKESRKQVVIYEGCGSVGDLYGPVRRSKLLTIEAYDQKGNKFQLTCDGLLARVIQHEYDHLQGIEFLEKISDYRKVVVEKYYRKNIKKSKLQVNNSKITVKKFKKI